MVGIFGLFKGKKEGKDFEVEYEEFVEISTSDKEEEQIRYKLKPLVINEYSDIKPAIKLLREREYILLLNTKNLKLRDSTELRRVVDRLKQIVEKIDGDIIGFGKGEWILVLPSGIKIDRSENNEKSEE